MNAPDPRYTAAIARERRVTDAIQRAQNLLLTHPDVDPVERLDIIHSLSLIDRRSL
jgi:hypothetical protein